MNIVILVILVIIQNGKFIIALLVGQALTLTLSLSMQLLREISV